jgi:hypothetical protein
MGALEPSGRLRDGAGIPTMPDNGPEARGSPAQQFPQSALQRLLDSRNQPSVRVESF